MEIKIEILGLYGLALIHGQTCHAGRPYHSDSRFEFYLVHHWGGGSPPLTGWLIDDSPPIIATPAEVTPNGGLVKKE